MGKIDKITTMALIFMLIGMFLFVEVGHSRTLRLPLGDYKRPKKKLGNSQIHFSSIPSHWTIEPDKAVYDKKLNPADTQLETKHAVSLVILDEEGKAVFVKRNPKKGDSWSIPSTPIDAENDPKILQKVRKSIKTSIGIDILETELIGKRMGYRIDSNRTESKLLMQVIFVTSYEGTPRLTGNIDQETGMPKYTHIILANPEDFLSGRATDDFDLKDAGDCTKCFGTIVFGSYDKFKRVFYAMLDNKSQPDPILASRETVEQKARKAFEKEFSLEGKMITLGEVFDEHKPISQLKDSPCYVVENLEVLSGLYYFRGEGRARYFTEKFILKDAKSYFEYNNNLPYARQGIMAIPIGFIYDKKEKRSYFVEEYIGDSIVDAFRLSGTEEREKLIKKLGKFVRRLYDMNIEPVPTHFQDPGHIRVRDNGEIAVTDIRFEEREAENLETYNAYEEIYDNIIPGLSRYTSEEEIQRLLQVFAKTARMSKTGTKLDRKRKSVDACN